MNGEDIKVSVCMITYLHERFIAEAIEGVLMQETSFEVELIIADDASPDNTSAIVNNYIKNHPRGACIKYTKHGKNLGVMPNFIWALQQCNGEFIALCEGDDFWIDPLKLQKQVDFLQANKEYVICFHDCKVVDQDGSLIKMGRLKNTDADRNREQLVSGAHLPTNTVLFRNILEVFPQEFYQVSNGDTFLFALLGHHGKAYFDKTIVKSVYRKHNKGVWSGKMKYDKLLASQATFRKIQTVSAKEFRYHINLKLLRITRRLIIESKWGISKFKSIGYFSLLVVKQLFYKLTGS